MVALDALGGDLIDLGPAPAPCAVGDRNDEMGFAQASDGRTLWLGPNLDVELEFDQRTSVWGSTPERALLVGHRADGDDVLVVDTRTGEQVGSTLPMAFATSAAQSPDRSLFVVTDGLRGFEVEDPSAGSTLVIDAATGELLVERDEPVVGRAFFDDATRELIVASADGTLSVVDPVTGETMRSTDTGVRDAPIRLWARDDGTLIAAYYDRVRFVDVGTGEVREGPSLDPLADATLMAGRYLTAWSIGGAGAVYDLASNAVLRPDPQRRVGPPGSRRR